MKLNEKTQTLTAVVTASPTTPGEACHVPSPTDGILAPVFSSKTLIGLAIIRDLAIKEFKSSGFGLTHTAFVKG